MFARYTVPLPSLFTHHPAKCFPVGAVKSHEGSLTLPNWDVIELMEPLPPFLLNDSVYEAFVAMM